MEAITFVTSVKLRPCLITKFAQDLSDDGFLWIVGINLFDMAVDELLIFGWDWSSSDSMFTASIAAQEFRTKNLPGRLLITNNPYQLIGIHIAPQHGA